jgi:parallel beta-helix repeat protein
MSLVCNEHGAAGRLTKPVESAQNPIRPFGLLDEGVEIVTARRLLIVLALAMAAVQMPGLASASTRTVIDVFPGKHALLQALTKANPHDVLNLHAGTYKDAITITKTDITLRAAGDGGVTIDGKCAQTATIEVEADGFDLQGPMTVKGGDFYEVDFAFVSRGSIGSVMLKDSCGEAEYGVNLFQTGPLQVVGNTATGFDDAGVYVGGIINTGSGQLLVWDNEVYNSNRGIIVEDSFNVDILLYANMLHDNVTSGIHLTNTDGIALRHNIAMDNGTYGIDLDSSSDNNTVIRNTAWDNEFDLANAGNGNCFKRNKYKTSQGPIGC